MIQKNQTVYFLRKNIFSKIYGTSTINFDFLNFMKNFFRNFLVVLLFLVFLELRAENLKSTENITPEAQNIFDLEFEKELLTRQKNSEESELEFLESKLQEKSQEISQKRLKIIHQESKLAQITREISEQKAFLRIEKQKQEKQQKINFLAYKNFHETPEIKFFSWVFSRKNFSEKLLSYQQKSQQQKIYSAKISFFEREQKKLQQKIRNAAEILGQIRKEKKELEVKVEEIENLKKLVMQQKYILQKKISDSETQIKLLKNQIKASILKSQTKDRMLTDEDDESDKTKSQKNPEKFSYPLKKTAPISAGFKDPEYKKFFGKEHFGVDFRVPEGTKVLSVGQGEVLRARTNDDGYSFVIIEHEEGVYSLYGHLSEILILEGKEVEKGEVIGKSGGAIGKKGSGTFTTGPHLHLEFFDKSTETYLDPAKILNLEIKKQTLQKSDS